MGEEVAGLPEAVAVGLEAGHAPEPIGAYLSRQRRLRGISLDELARATCIPLRSLERLESGAFDATPDGFARGFVRTVALALGLDPDETVSRMLPEATPGPRRGPLPLPNPGHPLAVAVFTLLLGALAMIFLVEWRGPAAAPASLESSYVYRRDVIRELAREQAARPPRPAVPAAPTASAEPALADVPAAPLVEPTSPKELMAAPATAGEAPPPARLAPPEHDGSTAEAIAPISQSTAPIPESTAPNPQSTAPIPEAAASPLP